METAPLPPLIIEKGLATDRVMTNAMAEKYVEYLPLYRPSAAPWDAAGGRQIRALFRTGWFDLESGNGIIKSMIPKHLASLFWDTNLAAFHPQEHPAFTIGRVLELGDEHAVRWMRETFSEEAILDVLRTDRRLTPRSANFWALLFHVPAQEVAALRS